MHTQGQQQQQQLKSNARTTKTATTHFNNTCNSCMCSTSTYSNSICSKIPPQATVLSAKALTVTAPKTTASAVQIQHQHLYTPTALAHVSDTCSIAFTVPAPIQQQHKQQHFSQRHFQ